MKRSCTLAYKELQNFIKFSYVERLVFGMVLFPHSVFSSCISPAVLFAQHQVCRLELWTLTNIFKLWSVVDTRPGLGWFQHLLHLLPLVSDVCHLIQTNVEKYCNAKTNQNHNSIGSWSYLSNNIPVQKNKFRKSIS